MPKKGKKGKKSKDEAPPPEPSEFDALTIDALKAQIAELKPRVERAQLDRNQVQLDRVRTALLCRECGPLFSAVRHACVVAGHASNIL
jgi:hypothetical protein